MEFANVQVKTIILLIVSTIIDARVSISNRNREMELTAGCLPLLLQWQSAMGKTRRNIPDPKDASSPLRLLGGQTNKALPSKYSPTQTSHSQGGESFSILQMPFAGGGGHNLLRGL